MSDREVVRVGLIGTGWIGAHHGHNVAKNPNAEIVAVSDVKPDNANAFLEKEKISARAYIDYREMLGRDDIDAVIIASPNSMHAEHAVAAAEAGKHIYLEKPMAITNAELFEQMRSAWWFSGESPQFMYTNCRMNEVTAAIGWAQLEKVDGILAIYNQTLEILNKAIEGWGETMYFGINARGVSAVVLVVIWLLGNAAHEAGAQAASADKGKVKKARGAAEPNMDLALQWWCETPNKWTPVGWKPRFSL
ncbi:MAG: Gfo/Idh/MocA family oxidoreductase [Armatimonadetes bacterium]|nr:Gfo/Idh/MocA family oxidoreductase [Armatimonadota bacterium]